MSYTQFRKFRSAVVHLYQLRDYSAALDMVAREAHIYPEQAAEIAYWRIFLLALSSSPQAALAAFQEAVDRGHWFTPTTLYEDPDLASLQGNPEFERLAAICSDRYNQASKAARPERVVFVPPPDTPAPYPLLLAFHGRNADAASIQPYWEGLSERGWLVVLAQSSQVIGVGSFAWDDRQQAVEEACQHFNEVSASYPVHWQRLVLAGFSQGAGLAIWLAVQRLLPVSGFIAVAPYLPDVESKLGQPSKTPAGRLRGYLLTGDLDGHQEMFAQIEQLLEEQRVSHLRERRPHLDHDFPADFDHCLDQAIQYIYGE
jgi:predicted esterase